MTPYFITKFLSLVFHYSYFSFLIYLLWFLI